MPSPASLLRGFGFAAAARRVGYKMSVVRATHIPVQRFERYRYNVKLKFTRTRANSNVSALRSVLSPLLHGTRVINSAYGNPYKCTITNSGFMPDFDRPVLVTFNATAVKIHGGTKKSRGVKSTSTYTKRSRRV